MAGIGFLLAVLTVWTVVAMRRTRGRLSALLQRRKLLLAWVCAIPLPYIAVESGWIVREVGRQPWAVYGLLRTSEAASPVSSGAVGGSIAMFAGFYIVLPLAFAVFALKWLRKGPDLTLQPVAREYTHPAIMHQEVL